MDLAEIGVVAGAILLIAFILWFFFGSDFFGHRGSPRSQAPAPAPPATKERRSI